MRAVSKKQKRQQRCWRYGNGQQYYLMSIIRGRQRLVNGEDGRAFSWDWRDWARSGYWIGRCLDWVIRRWRLGVGVGCACSTRGRPRWRVAG